MDGNGGTAAAADARIDRLERWAERHEDAQVETQKRIFERLDELTHCLYQRLPPWGTALVAVLSMLVGVLGGALFM